MIYQFIYIYIYIYIYINIYIYIYIYIYIKLGPSPSPSSTHYNHPSLCGITCCSMFCFISILNSKDTMIVHVLHLNKVLIRDGKMGPARWAGPPARLKRYGPGHKF